MDCLLKSRLAGHTKDFTYPVEDIASVTFAYGLGLLNSCVLKVGLFEDSANRNSVSTYWFYVNIITMSQASAASRIASEIESIMKMRNEKRK